MKTREELLAEYQLHTVHPFAGFFFGLVWWSHDKQNQIILSRTWDNLVKLWEGVFKRCDDIPEPKQLWKMQMVSPPEEWVQGWREWQFASDVDSARNMLCVQIRHVHKQSVIDFPNIAPCPGYVSRWGEEETEPVKENHVGCKNCHEGLVITIPDEELIQLVEFWGAPWRSRDGKTYMLPDRNRMVADPDHALFVAKPDPGHHCRGSIIEECTAESIKYLHSPMLFFFQGEDLDIPKELLQSGKKLKRQLEAEEKERNEKFKKERDKEKKEKLNKLMNILSRKFPG